MRPPEDLNVHKSMGPKALHPRVLRDLADGTAEALIILESHGSHVKPPETGEKGIRRPYCTLSIFKADLLGRLFTVSCSGGQGAVVLN